MFAGKLNTFSITSLIQICYNDGNTGAIEFRKDSELYGQIGLNKGSVVYADFLGIKGINAVKQLSLLKDLNFTFNEKAEPPETNIKTDINFFLIDCSRYIDECKAYLQKLKKLFASKYKIQQVLFYEYEHSYFNHPDTYNIKYFEVAENDNFTIIYFDKNIGTRVKLLFKDKILTDDILMFMEAKGIFR